jgi:hypothetical protein
MPANVDIIVSSPDGAGAELMVEARLALPDVSAAESGLKYILPAVETGVVYAAGPRYR